MTENIVAQVSAKAFGVQSGEYGTVEAIVAVFSNVDRANERVMPGAFSASLKNKIPSVAWSHDWKNVVARCVEAVELLPGDPRLPGSLAANGGLYVKCEFPFAVNDSNEAYLKLKHGLVKEWSIGYTVLKSVAGDNGVTDLTELDLHEVSPVMVGANPATVTISVKGTQVGGNDEFEFQKELFEYRTRGRGL